MINDGTLTSSADAVAWGKQITEHQFNFSCRSVPSDDFFQFVQIPSRPGEAPQAAVAAAQESIDDSKSNKTRSSGDENQVVWSDDRGISFRCVLNHNAGLLKLIW